MELSIKEMGEYLKNLRENKGLSTREVYELSKVSNSYLSLVENGHRRASAVVLKKLAPVYGVDYLDLYVKAGYADLAEYEKNKKNKNDRFGNPVVILNVLGTVKAGYNGVIQEEIIDTIEVSKEFIKSNEEYLALKIKGDSMFPVLFEDDVVLVQKQEDFDNGDIVVALINGDEATVKKAKKSNNSILLQPLNNNYEPLIFSKEDIEKIPIKIIGIVKRILDRDLKKC